ncbi:hypothetical protein ACWGDX_24170 [Streptomyces sp. NPDC055025]
MSTMDGELTLRRIPGGIEVVHAPRITCIALDVIAAASEHALRVNGSLITVAHQVDYQVTAWQASPPGLTVVLVADRRTPGEAT